MMGVYETNTFRIWLLMVLSGSILVSLPPISSSQTGNSEPFITKITDDRPWATVCEDPYMLPNPTEDVNNMPQGEVMIDVSEEGRLAAVAKDYRYSPVDDTTYNMRVWDGLYLSNNRGDRWRNLLFQDSNPNIGLQGVTTGAFGQTPGTPIQLTQESDPVVAFDRDGNLYTCALAYRPDPPGAPNDAPSPSTIVVSRRNRDGNLVPGTTHFLALENDGRLFNDKNWIAVDRTSPVESTVVIMAWRLFTFGNSPPAQAGGHIMVSADGATSFGAPIRLPIPIDVADASQFYQPLIGPDPLTGRKTLYIIFRTTNSSDYSMAMHLVKADITGLQPGTPALHEHLAEETNWTYLQDRIPGLFSFGSSGYDGGFRFSSYFSPAIDRSTRFL